MATVPESFLTLTSRTLLVRKPWSSLTGKSVGWSLNQRCGRQRHASGMLTEARRNDASNVWSQGVTELKKAPPEALHSSPGLLSQKQDQNGSSGDGTNGVSSVLRPLRFVMDRLFTQQQQEQRAGRAISEVDAAPHPGVPTPSSTAAELRSECSKQQRSMPQPLGGNGVDSSQADSGSDSRSITELTTAADWELQRAYALLKRLGPSKDSKDGKRSRDSTDGGLAEGESADGERSAGDGASESSNGASNAHDSFQKRTRRLRNWARMPALSQLSGQLRTSPLPDLPPVKVEHPAVQLAWRRAKAGSRPGARSDNAKLGLVVEGGGMRGVVSAGSLMTLYELGLKDSFDAVYGTSAGAINCTYFLTGQREGVDIYPEDIANKMFIDLRRFVGRDSGPVLDLGFLIDNIMQKVKPLRWNDVIKSNVPLKVVASCLDALGPVVLQDFYDEEDLQTCLKASANIPVIAGGPVLHRGRRLVDGAVFEGIPFRQAIADGCTHVIVCCTRPPFRGGRLKKAVSDFVEAAVKRQFLSPEFMRSAWKAELQQITAEHMTGDEMLVLSLQPGSAQALPLFRGAYVAPLYPSSSCSISPVCIESEVLRGGISEGRRIVSRTFDPDGQGMPLEVRARLAPDVRAAIERAAAQEGPPSSSVPPLGQVQSDSRAGYATEGRA